jgi:hypothetical protein
MYLKIEIDSGQFEEKGFSYSVARKAMDSFGDEYEEK